jgi:hypothetical protein
MISLATISDEGLPKIFCFLQSLPMKCSIGNLWLSEHTGRGKKKNSKLLEREASVVLEDAPLSLDCVERPLIYVC